MLDATLALFRMEDGGCFCDDLLLWGSWYRAAGLVTAVIAGTKTVENIVLGALRFPRYCFSAALHLRLFEWFGGTFDQRNQS